MTQIITLITEGEKDYELLDSGSGEKLERYGDFLLARPDPQALWGKQTKKQHTSKEPRLGASRPQMSFIGR